MEGTKRIFLIFKCFMVLVYLGMGFMILYLNVLPLSLGKTGRIFFGIIFILYGIFRFYTLYKSFMEKSDEE